MVTIEALQFACPVVGANNGGTKELIETYKGGVCFETLNSDSLNLAIDLVLDKDFTAFNRLLFQQHFDFNHVCALVETEVLGPEAPIFQ